jgi:hypothetical protein
MRFDTKIAIAVREDLRTWQKLNVTAFLASGLAAGTGGVMGKPYEDGDGNAYLELFRQPVVVYAATAEQLSAGHRRALVRGLAMAVYTEDMFTTDNDEDNRAVVRRNLASMKAARSAPARGQRLNLPVSPVPPKNRMVPHRSYRPVPLHRRHRRCE